MELLRALATLAEPPAAANERVWTQLAIEPPHPSAFTDLFVLQLPPYASIYLGPEGMVGGEARDRIAGFWEALDVAPPVEPDHLSALLGMYASLAERNVPQATHARAALLHEHLLSWLPLYLAKFEEIAGPSYRAWAALVRDALAEEAATLPQPQRLPLHLREAAPLPDPRAAAGGSETFIAGLLAPVRSGILLVRYDLARGSRVLDLGLRAGERRFALGAFFNQDPTATLGWLADEARAWMQRHRVDPSLPAEPRAFWVERARSTGELVESLRAESAKLQVGGST